MTWLVDELGFSRASRTAQCTKNSEIKVQQKKYQKWLVVYIFSSLHCICTKIKYTGLKEIGVLSKIKILTAQFHPRMFLHFFWRFQCPTVAGQAGAALLPPCLGISSSHSCNSLEDAGLGLFVPSGAERAYFRLCTMHFRLGCCAESIVLRSRLLPLQNSQWSKFFPV